MKPHRATNLIKEAPREVAPLCPAPHIFGKVHKCVDGGEPFVSYRHLRYIGDAVARAVAKGGGRILINIGPRHGKSFLLSKITPAWFLEHWPHKRVIVAGYGSELAKVEGRWVRNFFDGNKATRTRLSDDSTAADRWNTPEGGGMKTGGVGTGITGFGGHLMVFDDPYKDAQDAFSPTYRQAVVDWYRGVFYDRAEPGATIIVCHHRWHQDDLTTWLLNESGDQWTHIRLPTLAEANDPLGRAPGEVLCPQRYSQAAVHQMRTVQGEFFDAKHQQAPRAIGTGTVYSNYGPWNEVQSIEPRKDLPLCLDLDFNINPGMHAEISQYDPRQDLFAFIDEIHGPRMTLMEALKQFEEWVKAQGGWKWSELHIYGDASGESENVQVGESCYDLIRRFFDRLRWPYRLKVPSKNPPVVERIAAMQDALKDMDGKPHVQVSAKCVRLRADFLNLKSNEQGTTQKSDNKLSHASEAAGYKVHYLRPIGGPVEPVRGRFSFAVA